MIVVRGTRDERLQKREVCEERMVRRHLGLDASFDPRSSGARRLSRLWFPSRGKNILVLSVGREKR